MMEAFQVLSQPNMWVHIKSTMYQNWINDGSTVDQWWINDPSTMIYNLSRTQELYYLQYKMECENGNETVRARQICHSEIVQVTF